MKKFEITFGEGEDAVTLIENGPTLLDAILRSASEEWDIKSITSAKLIV